MGFDINWEVTHPNIVNHILYQKWSVKPMSSVIAGKADLITDIGKVIMNKDSVVIMAYLSWLARSCKLMIDLS